MMYFAMRSKEFPVLKTEPPVVFSKKMILNVHLGLPCSNVTSQFCNFVQTEAAFGGFQ